MIPTGETGKNTHLFLFRKTQEHDTSLQGLERSHRGGIRSEINVDSLIPGEKGENR